MGLIETLSKEYPVPYKRTRDMSESEYMKLVDRNTDLLDENKTLKEEIERLNNIINESNKMIDKIIEEVYKPVDKEWDNILCIIEDYKLKLQELKGVIKSEYYKRVKTTREI